MLLIRSSLCKPRQFVCRPRQSQRNIMINSIPFKIGHTDVCQKLVENKSFFEESREIDKDSVKQRYLPFYGGDFRGVTTSYTAKYGIDRSEITFEHNKSGHLVPKVHTVTDWYDCEGTLHRCDYPFGRRDLQVYGGFNYHKHYVEDAYDNNEAAHLQKINVDNGIITDKHEMDLSFAYGKMVHRLQKAENQRAATTIKNLYRANHVEVKSTTLHLNEGVIKMFTYYLPAFIYTYSTLGLNMTTIINGYSGKISGQKIYSVPKMATVIGLSVGALSSIYFLPIMAPSLFFGIIGGSSLTGLCVSYLVTLRQQYTHARYTHKIDTNRAKNLTMQAKQHEVERARLEQGELHRREQEERLRREQEEQLRREQEERLKSEQEELLRQEQLRSEKEELAQNQRTDQERQRYEQIRYRFTKEQQHFTTEEIEQLNLLGLSRFSKITPVTLKQAYHQQLKKWHPDKYKHNPDIANIMTVKINQAYENLKKKTKG